LEPDVTHIATTDPWNPSAERADPDTARERASAALRRQIERLVDSPFHRRQLAAGGLRPADISTVDDLHRLPCCDKDQLRESQETTPPFGDHLASDPDAVRCVYQTSGTSGRPAVIALTDADIEAWTEIGARSYRAAGITTRSSVITTFGAGPFVAAASHRTLARLGCRVVPVGPGDTERVIGALRLGLADTLLCTPTFALHLLDRTASGGDDPTAMGLRHLVTGGEPGGGLPAVRASLESGFDATVVEVMGIGDISASLFGETPDQLGMHFCGQDHVWPELIDDHGDPVGIEAGATGELVLTALTREAMPLLRFRTRDIVEVVGVGGPCGRTSFRMRCVGRTDDLVIVRGVNLYPSAVQAIVGEFRPRVTGRSCIVVDGDDIAVEPPVLTKVEIPDLPLDDHAALAAEIERTLRDRLVVRARVEFVPASQFGPAGYKTRGLVRRTSTTERGSPT
jgi:phenylacetate-CoA ligase